LEPITTRYVDVFVMLPTAPGGSLLALGPIYEYLLGRGYQPRGQSIIVEGRDIELQAPGTPFVERR
jgi:hypothetical protein